MMSNVFRKAPGIDESTLVAWPSRESLGSSPDLWFIIKYVSNVNLRASVSQ